MKEIIFGKRLGGKVYRCHAEVVKDLPEKQNRFSLGYAELGLYDIDGHTYRIYTDRDCHDVHWGYYAIEV